MKKKETTKISVTKMKETVEIGKEVVMHENISDEPVLF
jgi:hypothetical protein